MAQEAAWISLKPSSVCSSLQQAWPVNKSEVRWAATQRRPTGPCPWLGETPWASVAPERVCSMPEKPAQWTRAHSRGRGQGSIIALSLFVREGDLLVPVQGTNEPDHKQCLAL